MYKSLVLMDDIELGIVQSTKPQNSEGVKRSRKDKFKIGNFKKRTKLWKSHENQVVEFEDTKE